MSKPEFVYVTYIETTPEKLWEALTDGEFTERYWFGAAAQVGLEGRLAVRDGAQRRHRSPTPARSSNADPPRRLAYTFVNLSDEVQERAARARDLRARALRQAGEADADP